MTASEVLRNLEKALSLNTSSKSIARDLTELSKFISQGKPSHVLEKDWELLVRLYDKIVEDLRQKIKYFPIYR